MQRGTSRIILTFFFFFLLFSFSKIGVSKDVEMCYLFGDVNPVINIDCGAECVGNSTEEVQDAIGTMVTGNTETRITVTYDDANNELDFVVDEFGNTSDQIFGVCDNSTFQYEIGADCGAGNCIYGINDDGSLDCRACSSESGISRWLNTSTYLYPNSTYAQNVWVTGWFNVTSFMNVYGNATFHTDVNITGDLNVSGTITGEYMNINSNVDVGNNLNVSNDIEIGGYVNDTGTNSYFYFDENGALVVHIE